MLPQDPGVLLVDADGIPDRDRTAPAVVDDRIQVADLAEAVAAVLEGISEIPDAVLAHVERVPVKVRGPGIAVRDDHVDDRGPVEDWAVASLVVVGHGV